ncbi:IS30 family transposase [Stenotrophomonas sp. AS1]|uniref:IS30 family transposase n=1 Tax=Stenotrophomonas sp. AS1 TaxID=3029188 RepID=UPI003B79FE1F
MERRPRIYYSDAQKALMWERWRRGESLHKIATLFDRHHSSVRSVLSESGGIQPVPRRRSERVLSLAEREEISRGVAVGKSMRAIASSLGRAPAMRVAAKLKQQWSPQQVSGWLKRTNPEDTSRQVSHETIYRTLYIQSRGALKQELLAHLRRTRAMRRSRHHTQKTADHGRIKDTISISERPPSVEDRAVPGHWEGDLLFGDRDSQIATLVERKTRYVMLVKVDGKDSETVVNALIKSARRLPRELYRSLTWDRGKEMAAHRRFTLATDIQVYFCDPHHPWQRGTNENTNGLLRQYFPKGVSLANISQAQLDAVARQLNERPRKTLGYETPVERYRRTVASIG